MYEGTQNNFSRFRALVHILFTAWNPTDTLWPMTITIKSYGFCKLCNICSFIRVWFRIRRRTWWWWVDEVPEFIVKLSKIVMMDDLSFFRQLQQPVCKINTFHVLVVAFYCTWTRYSYKLLVFAVSFLRSLIGFLPAQSVHSYLSSSSSFSS